MKSLAFRLGRWLIKRAAPEAHELLAGVTRDYQEGLTYKSRVDQLVEARGATWTRTTEDNGATVVIRIHLRGGDVLTGRGPTTDEARADLEHRLHLFDAVES